MEWPIYKVDSSIWASHCRIVSILKITLALLFLSACTAQSEWAQTTKTDLSAAHQMILDSHPAGTNKLGDHGFLRSEEQAYSKFFKLTKHVNDYNGYRAILSGYAVTFNDSHIAPIFSKPSTKLHWPGFLTQRRGDNILVIGSVLNDIQDGDRLVSCDGKNIEEYASETLGEFVRNWKWEANRIKATPYLLLDQGNPFIKNPELCKFMREASTFTQVLEYRDALNDQYYRKARKEAFNRPTDFSIQPFDQNGLWISLPQLSGEGYELAKEAQSRSAELRSAAFVVVDVRGNGGGNSIIGDQLAEALGLPPFAQNHEDDLVHWRLSDGNIKEFQAHEKDQNLDVETRQYIGEMVKEARTSLSKGDVFLPPLKTIPQRLGSIQSNVEDHATARVLLLTDQYCFSSCLMLAQCFIATGAAHIGVITDRDSWYMEVNRRGLPSGHASFSTMMKVNLNYREALGPYQPSLSYRGDISDTEAVKAWVKSFRQGTIAARP